MWCCVFTREKMGYYFLYPRIVILCLIACGVLLFLGVFSKQPIKPLDIFLPTAKPMKKILYWNKLFKHPDFNFGSGHSIFVNEGCPENRCTATFHRDGDTKVHDFDAILFHGANFPLDATDFPPSRLPHQRYVLYLQEAPGDFVDNLREAPTDFFNWTMTYRLDSDVLSIYGHFKTLTSPSLNLKPPTTNWQRIPEDFTSADLPHHARKTIATKTKLVSWLESRCTSQSKREDYINELGKHIDIDVYGKCGNSSCKPSRRKECYRKIEKTYKFYLSFENSVCHDYVTEKLFHVMRYYVVPIVYGGANYSERAPPGSYIDAGDFKSPRHLARYLLHLDAHPEEYAKYFWWKKHYEPVNYQYRQFCQLCEMLHREGGHPKSYGDINEWYQPSGICQNEKYASKVGIMR